MSSKSGARFDRRQALVGVLAAAAGTLASSAKGLAVPAPEKATEKAYAAFFMGQGGYLFSWGIPYLAFQAREFGMETDIFGYSELRPAWRKIWQKSRDGYKIALVGYSLGNTTITYLQKHFAIDLLLAISESSLGRNHPIKKENTKRSVLWYGPDFLSNAGLNDGFDKINYINALHLWMDVDPRVVKDVLGELKSLVALDKPEVTSVALQANVPEIPNGPDNAAAAAPAPTTNSFAGWTPRSNVITPDVTCARCWGFEQNLAAARGIEAWGP